MKLSYIECAFQLYIEVLRRYENVHTFIDWYVCMYAYVCCDMFSVKGYIYDIHCTLNRLARF